MNYKHIRAKLLTKTSYDYNTGNAITSFLRRDFKIQKILNFLLNSSYWLYKKTKNSSFKIEASPTDTRGTAFFKNKDRLIDFAKFDREKEILSIYKLLEEPSIKVVSFDVFDTLLKRAVLVPTDVLYLLARKVKNSYGHDFYKLRLDTEYQLTAKDPNTSLEDVYKQIGKVSNIPVNELDVIKGWELELEESVLIRNEPMYKIFKRALELKKRIVIMSDMYLSSDFIKKILEREGYNSISNIYVSCDLGKRKDDGTMFKFVLEDQGIKSSELLHIGDNYRSDYQNPLTLGIAAFHYCTDLDYLLQRNSIWSPFLSDLLGNLKTESDWMYRLIFGSLFQTTSTKLVNSKKSCFFPTLEIFISLAIAPLLIASMTALRKIGNINNLKSIFFASRDGFLPHKVFEILEKSRSPRMRAEYFYAGRTFYGLANIKNLEDFSKQNPNLSFSYFVEYFIHDAKVREEIKEVSPEILKFKLSELPRNFKAKGLIDNYIEHYRSLLVTYYSKIFDEKDVFVFDTGYSGSIGVVLSNILQKKITKIYFWETSKNRDLDERDGTQTISFLGTQQLGKTGSIHLVLEELFSPSNPRALGLVDSQNLRFIEEPHSQEMVEDLELIQKTVLNCAEAVARIFGDNLLYFSFIENEDHFTKAESLLVDSLVYSPFNEPQLFSNIAFEDFFEEGSRSLRTKLSNFNGIAEANQLVGTGLLNPDNYISFKRPSNFDYLNSVKVGIHIHLYYLELSQEVINYLTSLPESIDLFITYPKNKNPNGAQVLFKSQLKNKITWLPASNKGRDVAPWLIELRKIECHYDYFCHLHTKKSKHMDDVGNLWRKYLFNSLLSPTNLESIFTIFKNNPKIGCILPAPFPNILSNWNTVPVVGKNEIIIVNLLKKIYGSKYREFEKNDLIVPAGTMFWYRPLALSDLFRYPFSYNDFPEEPIGLDGTLAHAVERVIYYVSERAGFETKFLKSDIQRKG